MVQHSTLRVISAYRGMANYLDAARLTPDSDLARLWSTYVTEPYWADWAAGQFNEARTREEMGKPITDLAGLEAEVRLLTGAGLETLVERAYAAITRLLPSPSLNRAVCLYALNPQNEPVRDSMNGVLGTCIGDNILLQINPTAINWAVWVPYVLAHEYHHTVWGYNYFAVRHNTHMDLLTSMLTDGQADSFARILYPELQPLWTNALTPAQEAEQWQRMQDFLPGSDDAAYRRFMFGDAATSTPGHTGYTIGYHIAQAYLQTHPATSILELLDIDAHTILAESGYHPAAC
jgi:uncharacterized protein YjaZ